MKMRDALNLIENSLSRLYPSKERGSDYDADETTLQSLERQGVGKGASIEDQQARREEAQKSVEQKRVERYKAANGVRTDMTPNPDGKFQWSAVFDKTYKPGQPIGRGDTEAKAIEDLIRAYEARFADPVQAWMPRPIR
jgi:hypothetical protein